MADENIPVIPRLDTYINAPPPPPQPTAVSAQIQTLTPTQHTVTNAGKSMMELATEYKYWIIGAIVVIIVAAGLIWYFTREEREKNNENEKDKEKHQAPANNKEIAPAPAHTQLQNNSKNAEVDREANRQRYMEQLSRGQAAQRAQQQSQTSKPIYIPRPVVQPPPANLQQPKVVELENDHEDSAASSESIDELLANDYTDEQEQENPTDTKNISSAAGKCTAITQNGKGKPCGNKAISGGRCGVHAI